VVLVVLPEVALGYVARDFRIVGMRQGERDSFERRYVRGFVGGDCQPIEGFVQRSCSQCLGECLDYADVPKPLCFNCTHAKNVYAEKAIRMSVDASCDDSTNPQRVAEGTAGFNLGLPGVPGDAIGKDAYGQIKRKVRPVSNSEIGSARRLREMAKRANLTQLEPAKRAVG
jgi:hypothetical protein